MATSRWEGKSPVYRVIGPVWSDVIRKDEIPEPALEALRTYAAETHTRILSRFHSAFAWGWMDDDYTHILVLTTEGEAYVVEGAALRPTLVTKLE